MNTQSRSLPVHWRAKWGARHLIAFSVILLVLLAQSLLTKGFRAATTPAGSITTPEADADSPAPDSTPET